uniref:Uncharacterized protein n=1 Tax=viral metagenome TaxID=1070528 RepID=A0A6M3JK51_9ZZZZ
MKINVANKEKMQIAINAAQTKVNARTADMATVDNLIEVAEKWLKSKGIPKSCWPGSKFSYAEHVNCNSYSKKSFTADSTEIYIECGASGWFLTGIRRVSLATGNNSASDYNVSLSELARNSAIENFKKSLWKI